MAQDVIKGSLIHEKIARWRRTLIYLSVTLLISMVGSMIVGPVAIGGGEVIMILLGRLGFPATFSESHAKIIMELRLPRILFGALIGAALSAAGAAMQGIFRNPLAGPYVLGVSSGAAFGAALSMTFLPTLMGLYTTPLAAFIGGVSAMSLVYGIAKFCRKSSISILLLAGVSTAYIFSALLSAVTWIFGKESSRILLWVLGGLWEVDWIKLEIASPIIIGSLIPLIILSRDLNAILLGEEHAQAIGVNLRVIRIVVPVAASMATSASVCFTGAIGFIGLMVPHMMRLMVGPDHRILIPSSMIFGGIFLIWADAAARYLMELPVGVITSLSGVPFFIYLLRKGGSA